MNDQILTIFSQIPSYIFYKDLDLVFRGGNYHFAKIAGLESEEDINGKTDYDFPWSKSQADLYRKRDKLVLNQLIIVEQVEPQLQASGKTVNVYVRKSPLYNQEGELIGLIGSYVESNFPKLPMLPARQSACLKYLVKGLPSKEIAKEMGLSVRTVEYYIRILKIKFGCRNKSALISKALLGKFFINNRY